jgi:hypothetical protein
MAEYRRWTVPPQVSAMRSTAHSARNSQSCVAALSARIAEQKRIRVAAIKPALEQDLQETPAPSPRQMAKRLGFSADCVLKAHARGLYNKLKARWQAYAETRRGELRTSWWWYWRRTRRLPSSQSAQDSASPNRSSTQVSRTCAGKLDCDISNTRDGRLRDPAMRSGQRSAKLSGRFTHKVYAPQCRV